MIEIVERKAGFWGAELGSWRAAERASSGLAARKSPVRNWAAIRAGPTVLDVRKVGLAAASTRQTPAPVRRAGILAGSRIASSHHVWTVRVAGNTTAAAEVGVAASVHAARPAIGRAAAAGVAGARIRCTAATHPVAAAIRVLTTRRATRSATREVRG